ncbi:hypothetical protein [Blautia obeum]|nr:hypothetical protein [Blautia obeum]RGI91935.1 hypothetical protein DXD81_09740 [Blautia obeum]
MALPQDGQNANGLTKVTEIPKGKELIFIDPTTNEGGIITLEDLTTQILKNLTSQTFALDQGNMTLLAALNQLNSNSSGLKFIDGGTITQAEAQSADQAAQIVFDNKIPVSEGIIVFVNFIFAFRYSMIVQKYGRGDYGAYILFGCNVPTLTYHIKTAGTWN